MREAHLVVEGLRVSYGTNTVVEGLDLEVGSECVVLFGPSGCGKTTILRSILGAVSPGMTIEGRVTVDGHRPRAGSGDVGMVFQGSGIPEWLTVQGICKLIPHGNSASESRQETIEAFLGRFGLSQLRHVYVHSLSGGQRQRVAVLAALLGQPRVLLLDEPTTYLDASARHAVWEALEEVVRPDGIPTVVVTHDPIEAVVLADRVVTLATDGSVSDTLVNELPHPRDLGVLRSPIGSDLVRALADRR